MIYDIKVHKDNTIKTGDTVKLIDGSALVNKDYPRDSFYIICKYPKLGIIDAIKNTPATVIASNIDNKFSLQDLNSFGYVTDIPSFGYVTDILVEIGNTKFYTCSKFVEKIEK